MTFFVQFLTFFVQFLTFFLQFFDDIIDDVIKTLERSVTGLTSQSLQSQALQQCC